MILAFLALLAGTVLLYLGGEGLVSGGSRLAVRLKVSPMVVGLGVVAFGTSLPEFAASLFAVLEGVEAIAVGNIIGSNVANIALILGTSALVFPIVADYRRLRGDLWLVVAISALFVVLTIDGHLSRLDGGILTIGMILYILRLIRSPERDEKLGVGQIAGDSAVKAGLALSAGLVALLLGTKLFIGAAVEIATHFNISPLVIGGTIVALGTSLPELATSLVAAFRKQTEIVLGNVLGSNVFNLMAVLGVIPLMVPIGVAPDEIHAVRFQMGVMFGITLLLLPVLKYQQGIKRSTAVLLLLVYAGFIVLVFISQTPAAV